MIIHNKVSHIFPFFNPQEKFLDFNHPMHFRTWGNDECVTIISESYKKEANIIYIKPQNEEIAKLILVTFEFEILSGTIYYKNRNVKYIKEYC